MDKDLRASLVAAGAAVALSALVGVIAGVGILILFLRALACGVFVGAAAYGAIFLLRQTVPEVVAPPIESDGGVDLEMGGNVDIVLPSEGPVLEAESDVDIPSSLEAAEDEESGLEPAPPQASPYQAPSRQVFPRPKRKVETEGEALRASEAAELEDASLLEPEARGVEAVAAIPANASSARDKPGFEDLDVLPDLDGFSDSFTASEFASGGSPSSGSDRPAPRSGGSASPRAGQEGMDPASLAQAVRTILKRDQKG